MTSPAASRFRRPAAPVAPAVPVAPRVVGSDLMRTPVGRATLVALGRPVWAATSPDVVALLGAERTAALTSWARTAPEDEVLAAAGVPTHGALNALLGKLRRDGAPWADVPRGNAWTPTPEQVTLAVRYLEGRVGYTTILGLLEKVGPRPSLYQFKAWAAEAHGHAPRRPPGRPPGRSDRVAKALAEYDDSQTVHENAARLGVTTTTLKRALRDAEQDTAP